MVTMQAMSTAVAAAGSAAPATIRLSCSSIAFRGSSVQQLSSASRLNARSPAASFRSARTVAVRANQSPNEERRHKVVVALVAARAALTLNLAPVSPTHAELFGSDPVKVERGATTSDFFPGSEGTGTNAGVGGAANSGTPLGEGNSNTGSGLKVPDVGHAVRRKVEGAKEMAERAKSTVNGGVPDTATVVSEVVSSDGARNVRDAAGEVARNAVQSVVTNSAQQLVDGAKSGSANSLEALMSKITGK